MSCSSQTTPEHSDSWQAERAALSELGRKIVEEQWSYERISYKHAYYFAVKIYWEDQQELVAHRGECEPRCESVELVYRGAGRKAVCPHTNQPCQRRRLSKLVQFYGQINNGERVNHERCDRTRGGLGTDAGAGSDQPSGIETAT